MCTSAVRTARGLSTNSPRTQRFTKYLLVLCVTWCSSCLRGYYRMKYLITFEKGESVRWLGHLDILRTFERAIRRAELPIAFSTGFNPRERIAFANALSTGVTGAAELATIEFTEQVEPSTIVNSLNKKLPPGIQLQTAEEIPEAGSRDLLNSYSRAEIRVTCARGPTTTLESAQAAATSLL